MMVAACDPLSDENEWDEISQLRGGRPPLARPDIVLISIDDLNDWPSPFVGPKPTLLPATVVTPNMERLGKSGTVFQRAYCAAPMCGPSRSATLTGLPPYVSGVTQQENILVPRADWGPLFVSPDAIQTLPQVLKDGGYRTYGAAKVFHAGFGAEAEKFPKCGTNEEHESYDYCAWDHYEFLNKLVPEGYCESSPGNGDISDAAQPCNHKFDFATSPLPDAAVARYGVKRLEQVEAGAPMFLALGFFKPHKDWEAPAEFIKNYPQEALAPLDASVEKADQDDLSFTGCITLRDARNSPPKDTWGTATREAIAAYLGCITYVDHLLGIVLDAIEARPRRTIVILWSDHGYFMGEKRGWKKPALYERATRVPLIIADSAAVNPQSTYKIASLMDIFPTVLDYGGIKDPLGYGTSLRPVVEDETCQWDQTSVISTFNFRGEYRFDKINGFNADVERCMSEQSVTSCLPYVKSKPCNTEHPRRLKGASFALRTERAGERYRYIRYYDNGQFWTKAGIGNLPARELYDLDADPNEVTNLLDVKNVTKYYEGVAAALEIELSEKLAL